MENNNIYACLEIGSYEIKLLVCNFREDRMYVLSKQCISSIGIERGQVTNFKKLVGQIKKVKELAEYDLKQKLDRIMLIVSPIDTYVEPALAKINLDVNHPINEKNVRTLFMQLAQQPYSDTTHLPVNMIPRLFRIDENHLVQNPRGLSGMSLMLEANRVFAPIATVSNFVHAVESARFKIEDITTGSISEALSALNSPEMFMRSCHINIGHSLTTITIINEGRVRHTHAISIGGRDITHAIADEFGLTMEIADQLKIDFGRAFDDTEVGMAKKVIYVAEDKFITRGMLNAIITNQCDQIFKVIKNYVVDKMRIREQEYYYSLSGGTAELPNIMHILRKNFPGVESSLYRPSMLGIRNTKYSQLVGAAIFAHELALLVGVKNYNIQFDSSAPQGRLILKEKTESKKPEQILDDQVTMPEHNEKAHQSPKPQVEAEQLATSATPEEIPLLRERLLEVAREPVENPIKIFGEDDVFLLDNKETDDYLDKKLENSGVLVRFFDRIFNENEEDVSSK